MGGAAAVDTVLSCCSSCGSGTRSRRDTRLEKPFRDDHACAHPVAHPEDVPPRRLGLPLDAHGVRAGQEHEGGVAAAKDHRCCSLHSRGGRTGGC